LLANKKLFVITASGGDYSNEPMKSLDFVEPYVRAIMGFAGVTDITLIKAHGSNPETVASTSEEAMRSIDQLLRPVTAK
jgi:FMN-dependent NADH-azoreductase